jgi:hypothetical protein
VSRWSKPLLNFLLDLGDNGKDFRLNRLQRLIRHLTEFLELLDPTAVEPYMRDAVAKHAERRAIAA